MNRRLTLISLCWPGLASAHPMPGVGDFYSGLLHPFITIEQILPLIALSLLAGQQERRTAAGILWLFPASFFVGACAGLAVKPPSFVSVSNLAFLVLLGLLVALSRRIPGTLLLTITAALGMSQGLSIGAEITGDMEAYRFIPGAGLTALVVMSYGIGFVRWLKAPWAVVAIRVAGSWVAAIGIMVLGLK